MHRAQRAPALLQHRTAYHSQEQTGVHVDPSNTIIATSIAALELSLVFSDDYSSHIVKIVKSILKGKPH